MKKWVSFMNDVSLMYRCVQCVADRSDISYKEAKQLDKAFDGIGIIPAIFSKSLYVS